jgi:hypothetical protein
MLIQKIYKNLSKIAVGLLIVLIGASSFLSINNIQVNAKILAPVQVLESQDCAGMPLLATFDAWATIVNKDYYKAVGPCVDASKTVFFDCTLIFITGAKASCSQKSDAGSVASCMQNKDGFEKGPITNTPECKTLTQEVCAFEWDRQTTIKGCNTLFVTKPSVATVATEQKNDITIDKCETLTAADKAEIDKKVVNTKAQIAGSNYEKICKDSTGKIFGDCTASGTKKICKLPLNDAAKSQSQGAVGNGGAGASNAIGSLFTTLFNLVLAVISLLVWFAGTLLSYVMFLIGFGFILLLRVNPAANDWIGVALAPWGVIQSLANLLILGTFVFVAFAYILNITQYKTKIDSFLTNIVIVAIVMNLTLLGCASIINIAQGVGDAFVGGYSQVKNVKDPDDYNGIAQVFIGDTLTSFKKISSLRCNNVKGGVAGTGTTAQSPKKTGATKSVAQATTAVECGDGEGVGTLADKFGTLIGKDLGPNLAILVRESVYVAIVVFGILIFWRLLLLALIRAVTLWLLMVTSPLALVAYFSPEGFGLKKQADKWASSFFHYTIFYPAFVLGLVIAQEMTASFNSASANIAGTVSVAKDTFSTKEVILVLLSGIIAVGILKLLADFFETALKEVTDAAWSGAKTLGKGGAALAGGGAAVIRGASGGVAGITKFATGTLNNSLKNNISKLDTDIEKKRAERANLPTDDARRSELTTEIKDLKRKKNTRQAWMAKSSAINTGVADFKQKRIDPIANFTEMLPEYIGGVANIPKNITESFAKKRKARIDSFKAGDDLRKEAFIRNNSDAFGALGINADDNPNSKMRGEDQQSIAESGGQAYLDKKVKDSIKNAYDKSMGLDQQIARGIYIKRAERILAAAGGDFNNILDPKDRDFITDGIKQFQGDGVIMSQMAESPLLRGAVGAAMDSNSLDQETQSKLRKTNPIFIANDDERQRQVASLSEDDLRELSASNFKDQAVIDGAIQAGFSLDEIYKKTRNNGRGQVNEKKLRAELNANGMSEDAQNNLVRFSRNQKNQGINTQDDALVVLAQARKKDPNTTQEEARRLYDEAIGQQFGDEATIEDIKNRDVTGTDEEKQIVLKTKINDLNRASREMREYTRSNATRFATMKPEEVISEMLEANRMGKKQNAEVADSHFKILDESSRVGAKVLVERDTSRAVYDLNAQSYKNAENNGVAALSDTNFQTEIGIQGKIKKEVNDLILNPKDPNNNLKSVEKAGLTETFRQQYEAIAVASLELNIVERKKKMDEALKNAKNALEMNPEAVDFLQDKFGSADASGEFKMNNDKIDTIRNEFMEQGVKEAEELQKTIARRARSRQGGETAKNLDDAAVEVFKSKSEDAKAYAKKAQDSVVSKYSSQSTVAAAKILERSRLVEQVSETRTNERYGDTGGYVGPAQDPSTIRTTDDYGVSGGQIGPEEAPVQAVESNAQTPPQAVTNQTTSQTPPPQVVRQEYTQAPSPSLINTLGSQSQVAPSPRQFVANMDRIAAESQNTFSAPPNQRILRPNGSQASQSIEAQSPLIATSSAAPLPVVTPSNVQPTPVIATPSNTNIPPQAVFSTPIISTPFNPSGTTTNTFTPNTFLNNPTSRERPLPTPRPPLPRNPSNPSSVTPPPAPRPNTNPTPTSIPEIDEPDSE